MITLKNQHNEYVQIVWNYDENSKQYSASICETVIPKLYHDTNKLSDIIEAELPIPTSEISNSLHFALKLKQIKITDIHVISADYDVKRYPEEIERDKELISMFEKLFMHRELHNSIRWILESFYKIIKFKKLIQLFDE